MATSITVAQKDVNVQTSSDKDRMGSAVAKIVDLETEANEMICEYIQKREMIIQQIETISDTNMYHILFCCSDVDGFVRASGLSYAF